MSTPTELTSPASFQTLSQPPVAVMTAKSSVVHGVAASVVTPQPSIETCTIPAPAPPPSYEFSIQQKQQQQLRSTPLNTPASSPLVLPNSSPSMGPKNIPQGEKSFKILPPPPPYPSTSVTSAKLAPVINTAKFINNNNLVRTVETKSPLVRKYSPLTSETGSSASRSESPISDSQTVSGSSPLSFLTSAATEVVSNMASDSGIGQEQSISKYLFFSIFIVEIWFLMATTGLVMGLGQNFLTRVESATSGFEKFSL